MFTLSFVCSCFFLFIFHFGLKSGIWLLIAPVPVQCFSITYILLLKTEAFSSYFPVMSSFQNAWKRGGIAVTKYKKIATTKLFTYISQTPNATRNEAEFDRIFKVFYKNQNDKF